MNIFLRYRSQLHHGNIMALVLPVINGIFGLATVFIACEFGQRMADAFDEFNCAIRQFDWYLLSIEMQRMLPMIIVIVQKPVSMGCFGSIICGREVFKNVSINEMHVGRFWCKYWLTANLVTIKCWFTKTPHPVWIAYLFQIK